MVAERTEDLALRGVLPLVIGGQPTPLRTLTIEESDEWMGQLTHVLANLDIPESDDTGTQLREIMRASSEAALGLVIAYDVDGALGGEAELRKRATRKEVADALMEMVRAEDPLGTDGARSVAEVLGAPSRLVAEELHTALVLEMGRSVLRSGASTNGRSTDTASAGETSGERGARSSSSSAGPTRTRKTTSKR